MRGQSGLRSALLILALAVMSLTHPRSSRAAAPIQVSLVVVFPDRTVSECVEVTADDPKGADVLRAAGLQLVTDSSFGLGEAVCKIEATGCDYPAQQCFCECMGATCAYWNYWYWEDGAWVHSPMGASNRSVADGATEAWVWGGDQEMPPARDELVGLCQAPTPTPTDTLVPTATWTPTLTPSPSPSLTLEPSLTPTPTETLLPDATPSPSLSPTATSSSVPSATLEPSPTEPTATATLTVTPSPTVATPTATWTPWSAYPYGTPTASPVAGSTGTPWSAYPLTTATRTPTRTVTPLPSAVATFTPVPTPSALATQDAAAAASTPVGPAEVGVSATPSGPATVAPPPDYPAPAVAQALPSEATAKQGAGPAGPIGEAPTTPLAELSQAESGPGSAPTPDRVAKVLATSVAQAQASPTPIAPPERKPRRQYGAFVALAIALSLLSVYAHLLRRQRAWRHTYP